MKRVSLLLMVLVFGALVAKADSLVTVQPVGTDSINWSQLGSDYTTINNPFSFTTTLGVTGTGSYANSPGQVRSDPSSWYGNLEGTVNWTDSTAGPITLNFSSGFSQVGAQIQTDYYGDFTAQICDASSCFSENGDSDSNYGTAIYLGIASGSPIDSVTFSILSAPGGTTNDFAISDVTLNGAGPVIPEPSTWLLFGTGLLGLAFLMRKKIAQQFSGLSSASNMGNLA